MHHCQRRNACLDDFSLWGIHQCETTATAIMTTISQNKADNIQPTNRASAGKASTRRMIIRTRCTVPMRT